MDGRTVGLLDFHGRSATPQYFYRRTFGGLTSGAHTARIVLTRDAGHVDELVLFGRLLR